ncbi:MAG: signal peptide peptidase SppA [Dehalococcoidia bacterium]
MAFWRSKKIGVIELQGTIGRGIRPETHLPLLERARESRRIGALVLAVDSPGGSAPAAEELYLGVAKVAAVKPVVAYIRNLGASGALYVSVAAQKIVAVHNSLIGSIGVISARLSATELLQKIGLAFSVQKTGDHKDMMSPWREPTPEEEEMVRALIGEVYDRFVQVVAEERRMDRATVERIATGEVYTAQRALTLGLIDELGDLDRALDLAAEMAGIRRRVVYLRPRRRFFPMLRAGFAREMTQAVLEELDLGLSRRVWL